MSAPPVANPQDALSDATPARGQDRHLLTPPAAQYVRVDDKLIVDYASENVGAGISIAYRLMRTTGEIVEFQYVFNAIANGSLQTINVPLADGFLLGVTVGSPTTVGNLGRGQMFICASIGRLIAPATFLRCLTLFADYLSGLATLGWPGGSIRQATDGTGFANVVSWSPPAAGTEVSAAVQGNKMLRVKTLRVRLTTSAAVANRQVGITFEDTTVTVFYRFQTTIVQPASTTVDYVFVAGFAAQLQGGTEVLLPLPPEFTLPANARLRTVTANLQAADQYAAPQSLCDAWIFA